MPRCSNLRIRTKGRTANRTRTRHTPGAQTGPQPGARSIGHCIGLVVRAESRRWRCAFAFTVGGWWLAAQVLNHRSQQGSVWECECGSVPWEFGIGLPRNETQPNPKFGTGSCMRPNTRPSWQDTQANPVPWTGTGVVDLTHPVPASPRPQLAQKPHLPLTQGAQRAHRFIKYKFKLSTAETTCTSLYVRRAKLLAQGAPGHSLLVVLLDGTRNAVQCFSERFGGERAPASSVLSPLSRPTATE